MLSLMLGVLLSSAVDTPAPPGSAPVVAAPDATQTADQVQRYYDAAKELHAHFDQTVMTAMGTLSSGAIIGWWFGWSVYEVLIRLSGRRYVKGGPWWRGNYRAAGVMDMMSYVSFKNLLIGAALFLVLKSMGWWVA